MLQKQRSILAVLVLMAFLSGCARVPVGNTTVVLTPQQKAEQTATYFFNTYNSQYDSYLVMVNKPVLTPAEKMYLTKKKAILLQVQPLLKTYKSLVDSGGTPTAESTDELSKLIDRLTTLAIGG
jgi:hypothetical protein